MEGIVTFYNDQEGWYHAYNNDAIVVSNILGYRLFERHNKYNGKVAIGFEKQYFSKVKDALRHYNIGYSIYDDDITIEYANSKYNECLDEEFVKPYSTEGNIIKSLKAYRLKGSFTIQYNDESPITLKFDNNSKPYPKIVNYVVDNEVGQEIHIEEDVLKILSKDFELEKVDASIDSREVGVIYR